MLKKCQIWIETLGSEELSKVSSPVSFHSISLLSSPVSFHSISLLSSKWFVQDCTSLPTFQSPRFLITSLSLSLHLLLGPSLIKRFSRISRKLSVAESGCRFNVKKIELFRASFGLFMIDFNSAIFDKLHFKIRRLLVQHLIKQNCSLKTFLKTLILITWVFDH